MTDTEFQVSEPQTIASIHAGDRAAFASALERELDALYRFVARELRYHEALGNIHSGDLQPEDIVDEVTMQALEQARRIPSRSTLKGWLRHLALRSIHKHVNRLRLQSRMEAISLEDQLLSGQKWGVWYQPDAVLTWEDVLPAPVPSAEEALVLNETQEDLEKALNTLPSDQRLTFILRAIDGLSYAEVAAILNRPRSAVKDTYRTARKALREHFAGRFKRAEVQPASTASPPSQAEAGRSGPGEG